MTHANAPLAPLGRRRLAELIVVHGWPLRRAAERFQCSPATAARWAARLRAGESMEDRSSRPLSSPRRTPDEVEQRVLELRRTRRWGPHRIGYELSMPRSTVGRVLVRHQMPLLAHLDQATGEPIRRIRPVRYERETPGELVHMDVKKLGRIPDGGGHRVLGRTVGNHNNKKHRLGRTLGYAFLHQAIDDHSRLVYSEIHPDETAATTVEFWRRAHAFFTAAGMTVQRVMTDNGPAYRSHAFAAVLADQQVKHLRTRPYRPQTNGKVERFNRTLATEWAYATTYTSEADRAATYPDWLHHYNHHRPHTGIKGQVPADRVPNLTGNYS